MSHPPQPEENAIRTFKLLLVGDAGVGKTSFMRRHLTGEFETKYIPTDGAEVHPLHFSTSYGQIWFDVWDISGQAKADEQREEYYVHGQCAIILFDVTNPFTLESVPIWCRELGQACEGIPIVLCGNKVDVEERQVKTEDVTFHQGPNVHYVEISTESCHNFEEPFLYLARQLLGQPSLEFAGVCSMPPSSIDPALMKLYHEELERASHLPIPEEDDDT